MYIYIYRLFWILGLGLSEYWCGGSTPIMGNQAEKVLDNSTNTRAIGYILKGRRLVLLATLNRGALQQRVLIRL